MDIVDFSRDTFVFKLITRVSQLLTENKRMEQELAVARSELDEMKAAHAREKNGSESHEYSRVLAGGPALF